MSISIEEVFVAIFSDVYTYDYKYKELKSNQKLNIMNYPYPLRKLVYDNYYMIHDINKDCLTMNELEMIKDNDPDVKYIKNINKQADIFKDEINDYSDDNINVYNHLTEEDYLFINGDDNDKNHMMLSRIVKYNKTVLNTKDSVWNINYYLSNNVRPKNNYQTEILFNVIDYENLNKIDTKYLTYISFDILINRFVYNTSDLFDLAKQLGIYCETYDNDKMNTLINEYVDINSKDKYLFIFDKDVIKYQFEKVANYYLNSKNKLYKTIYLCSLYKNKEEIDKLYNTIDICKNYKLNDDKIHRNTFIKLLYKLFAKCYKSVENLEQYIDYFDDKYSVVNYYLELCKTFEISIEKETIETLMKPYCERYDNNYKELTDPKYKKLNNTETDEETNIIIKENNNFKEQLTKLINNLLSVIYKITFNIYNIKYYSIFRFSENFVIMLNNIFKFCVKNKSFSSLLNVVKQDDKYNYNYFETYGIEAYKSLLYDILDEDISNNKHEYKEYFSEVIEMLKNEEIYKDDEDSIDIIRNECVDTKQHTLGYYYIKAYKCIPMLEIYTDPEIENLSSIWRELTSFETPLEMTNKKYYDYMIKNNGKRRPSNITAIYSYFSNTAENKLIFIQNDETLDKPAKLRYIIPIEYEKVKEFITEDLDTNDICMFTTISNADWKKIANDNDRIDVVAFSDIKNVYKERTNFKKLIEFFKDAIELKFDCELTDELEV